MGVQLYSPTPVTWLLCMQLFLASCVLAPTNVVLVLVRQATDIGPARRKAHQGFDPTGVECSLYLIAQRDVVSLSLLWTLDAAVLVGLWRTPQALFCLVQSCTRQRVPALL